MSSPQAGPGLPPPDVQLVQPWLRLVDGDKPDGGPAAVKRRPPTARRVLWRFLAANLIVVTLLFAGSLWAGHRAARNDSLSDARAYTDLLASLLIEPNLSDAVLTGDPLALATLDDVVLGELRDADVVRIKIWDEDQRIVYSDEPRLIGLTFRQPEDQLDILRNGGMVAELSDLSESENQFERPQDEQLLEVYRRITTPSGERLLLETYFPYEQVIKHQTNIWLQFAPITASVLVLMLLVQVPLAKRTIRQAREGDRERLRLHARAADASTAERRRIAGSLHDGVVQDLSAAPLFMARALDRLQRRSAADTEDRDAASDLSVAMTAVRQSVGSLRSLLIDIYPPHLAEAGLPATLADLAARVQAEGVETRLDIPEDLDLPPHVEALLFRVAQEAMLNAAKHAHAGTVQLTLRQDSRSVTMEIRDDGAGFDASATSDNARTGHFGMRVLTDLAEDAGATLDLATAPGQGTALRLKVPLSIHDDRTRDGLGERGTSP